MNELKQFLVYLHIAWPYIIINFNKKQKKSIILIKLSQNLH